MFQGNNTQVKSFMMTSGMLWCHGIFWWWLDF